ncbi:MAG: hypothetical protein DCC67_09290, partial [Planctomycetota bacterium]
LLVKLREKRPSADTESEPTRVITVRLPKSMHEALRHEAHDLRTSMNKLCISKLLQVIDEELIPSERTSASASTTSNASNSAASSVGMASSPASLPSRNHVGSSLGSTTSSQPYPVQTQTAPPYKPFQARF